MNNKGVQGRVGSFNYIPYPKQISVRSYNDLLKYKKEFQSIWKEYYTMGSRRQEEENIERYREYDIRTFGHLKPAIQAEYERVIDSLENNKEADLYELYMLKQEKLAEMNERYEKMRKEAASESRYEDTEFGSINLGLSSEQDELDAELRREVKNLDLWYNQEKAKIEEKYFLTPEVKSRYHYLASEKVKHDYMREIVENKLLGISRTPVSRVSLERVSSLVPSPAPLYSEVRELPAAIPLFGEVSLSRAQQNAARQAKLNAILAAKAAGQRRGGSRRMTKRKRQAKKKNTRKH